MTTFADLVKKAVDNGEVLKGAATPDVSPPEKSTNEAFPEATPGIIPKELLEKPSTLTSFAEREQHR